MFQISSFILISPSHVDFRIYFHFPSTFLNFFGVYLCACARDDAIGGTMEESGRESQVK